MLIQQPGNLINPTVNGSGIEASAIIGQQCAANLDH
jgi:hypothetical protein